MTEIRAPSTPHMPYTVTPTHIPDLLVLEPKVFGDSRGFFFESHNPWFRLSAKSPF
jgi:dTDP-4-dehydrorhamnose 3,5-epimerase-like enzyme